MPRTRHPSASAKPPKIARRTYRNTHDPSLNRRTVSKWHLTTHEARALDLICCFGNNRAAAAYAGIASKTLDQQLYRAYQQMKMHGVVFDGCCRTQAMRLWMEYWLSEEGKANLRNVWLTQPNLA